MYIHEYFSLRHRSRRVIDGIEARGRRDVRSKLGPQSWHEVRISVVIARLFEIIKGG